MRLDSLVETLKVSESLRQGKCSQTLQPVGTIRTFWELLVFAMITTQMNIRSYGSWSLPSWSLLADASAVRSNELKM
jgi:hypothetical protein